MPGPVVHVREGDRVIFTMKHRSGEYEGNPANEWRGMQTVPLGASSGTVIEFIVPDAGEYLLVDHEFVDAQKGAVGTILVGDPRARATPDRAPMAH